MTRRRTLVAAAILLAGLGSTVSADDALVELTVEERAWLDAQPRVRLAPAPNFPPVEFFDDGGRYQGIVADYAALLEHRLGTRFEVVKHATWAEVVAATERGEIDVWMEAVRTEEREAFMRFSAKEVGTINILYCIVILILFQDTTQITDQKSLIFLLAGSFFFG